MRSYKNLIEEAELLASPPEVVAAFLKERAAQHGDELRNDTMDEECEAALRNRGEPLINLALAKYGRFAATVLPLFEGAEPVGAVRLATLSNVTLGVEARAFPVILFGGPEKTAAWLASAPYVEIAALFENPNLDDDFLCGVLNSSKPWDNISDEQLITCVQVLRRNKRMRTPYEANDGSTFDFINESHYAAVFDAAWKLAKRVPTNERWARALRWLYDGMLPIVADVLAIKNPLDVAARWYPDPGNAALVEGETRAAKGGNLSNYQGVRQGLARLALHKNSKLLADLLASEDPAFRAAAYADGSLTPEELVAAYHKDGELFFSVAMRNNEIWRTAGGRRALHHVAWKVAESDKHFSEDAPNMYDHIRDDLANKHPDWFKEDENVEPEPSDVPAMKADMMALAERMRYWNERSAFQIRILPYNWALSVIIFPAGAFGGYLAFRWVLVAYLAERLSLSAVDVAQLSALGVVALVVGAKAAFSSHEENMEYNERMKQKQEQIY